MGDIGIWAGEKKQNCEVQMLIFLLPRLLVYGDRNMSIVRYECIYIGLYYIGIGVLSIALYRHMSHENTSCRGYRTPTLQISNLITPKSMLIR